MLHRVYDLCAAHCSPRDADSGPHCRIHRYYSFLPLRIAMFKRTKALGLSARERPVLEHKSRSHADLHKRRPYVAHKPRVVLF